MKVKNSENSKVSLADQLSKLNKEELVTLLVHFSEEIKEVEQLLTLKFQDASSSEALASYKKMIRSHIKQNADRRGFVDYRSVSKAVVGAEMVMAKAEDVLERGLHLPAVQINFCVLHEMGDLLQSSDDSDGIVGDMIKQCLQFFDGVNSDLENMSSRDRADIFQLLLKESTHRNLEGWSEWQLSLMESALCLITNDKERAQWEQQLARLVNATNSSYIAEQVVLLQYQVIEKLDSPEEAATFLHANLNFSDFRKMAIDDAMQQQQWDKALKLVEEGERKDAGGLVDRWKKIRFDIYKATQQLDKQIVLAREFVSQGEYAFYVILQELSDKDEWQVERERILNELEHSRGWQTESLYRRLLTQEKETERLLHYVQKYNIYITEYYPYLVDEYGEEVHDLFVRYILRESADSTNRNQYRKVCQLVRHMIKAVGGDRAEKVVGQLRLAYPKRVAFIDELDKIKFN
ncbi:hypothetical protein [Paenibacillus oryzisoli]|uniref:Uncharacterized protein n=1 Tax=Paenibacillus oryzisoli TaxID=1850517 RepID=A0A198AF70_9BACL|nr:hypothetical protein [Paenibacillus oryzisoli]OAS19720.1 hypothetical protein A8708_26210 [Paenibacillus oryzisoli]